MTFQKPILYLLISWVSFTSWTLVSCNGHGKAEPPKPAIVFTKEVKSEQISDLLNYPARINAKVNASVLSESDGIIDKISVILGKQVRRGETLMVLNHTDPVYQYAPVRILSPFKGIVSAIYVNKGSHVVQGQKLAAVIDPSQLQVLVEIPAQDLSLLTKGMAGELKISSQESPLKVKISGISPFVDPLTGTAPAELDIGPKDPSRLSPGMQGQVGFRVNTHEGFLISDASVIYKGKDCFVKVVEQKKIKQLPVSLGRKQRGYVEVLKGLTPGLQLVERSSRFVADGEGVVVEAPQ